MVSQRYRSQQTIGGKLLRLEQKTTEAQASKGVPAAGSVGENALDTNSVTSDALAPNSVDSEAIGPGAVGTENLGVVEQINSGTSLLLNAPNGVKLGGAYTAPQVGMGYPLSLASDGSISVLGATEFVGVVQPTYYLNSLPDVKLDDGTIIGPAANSGQIIKWGGYAPKAGDRVVLASSGAGVFYVTGNIPSVQPPITYWSPQIQTGKWNLSTTANWDYYGGPSIKVSMTNTGVVTLHGMVRSSPSSVVGMQIGQVPVGMRPLWRVKLPVTVNSGAGQIEVWPTGEIIWTANVVSNTWIALNNAYYTVNPNLTWIPISFASGFTRWTGDTTNYPVPGYAIDPDGIVWTRGVAMATGTPTASQTIFTYNTGYRPAYNHHQMGTGNSPFYYGRVYSTGIRDWGGPSTSYISLEGQAFVSSDSTLWWTDFQPYNSFTNYGGSWATAGWTKTPGGFLLMKGLMNNGAINNDMFYMPLDGRPGTDRTIFSIPSNAAWGRFDVMGPDRFGSGTVQNGSATWWALDNIRYMAVSGADYYEQ